MLRAAQRAAEERAAAVHASKMSRGRFARSLAVAVGGAHTLSLRGFCQFLLPAQTEGAQARWTGTGDFQGSYLQSRSPRRPPVHGLHGVDADTANLGDGLVGCPGGAWARRPVGWRALRPQAQA